MKTAAELTRAELEVIVCDIQEFLFEDRDPDTEELFWTDEKDLGGTVTGSIEFLEWVVDSLRQAGAVPNGIEPMKNDPTPPFVARIKWGSEGTRAENQDQVSVYHFKTKEEMDAFDLGVNEAAGWSEAMFVDEKGTEL